MNTILLFVTLCVASNVLAAPNTRPALAKPAPVPSASMSSGDSLPLAETCDPKKCFAPNCRCASTHLDEKIPIDKTPQLVMLTFDDAVTALNYEYIQQALNGLTNPDGCPVAATFYVSHEYTDYSKVHALWAEGHEIALHSISHTPLTSYWQKATVETLVTEFGGQREMMSHFASIPMSDINGMRLPLFQKSGNASYEAMVQSGLTYDSSWATQNYIKPGMWPYSLDYASAQDCPMGSCPTASIPGAWVAPLIDWVDMDNNFCAMVDACIDIPEEEEEIVEWMKTNFHRIYDSNRAPFGVYIHTAWFLKGENHFGAYVKFIEYLNSQADVYMVSGNQVIEYTRNPRQGKPFDKCVAPRTPTCEPRVCALKKKQKTWTEERWMTTCAACPAAYPWLGNPLGDEVYEE